MLETIDVPDGANIGQHFHSALLKSNCRVTSQPDWGDVFIYINTNRYIDKTSLLKYVVSFRGECHFHEEICECIYKRLHDKFNPEALFVMCLYARRGGIDINPVRASNVDLLYRLSNNLSDVTSPHVKKKNPADFSAGSFLSIILCGLEVYSLRSRCKALTETTYENYVIVQVCTEDVVYNTITC